MVLIPRKHIIAIKSTRNRFILLNFFCMFNRRLSIDGRQPLSFGIALFIEFILIETYMSVSIVFLIIYISISTYIRPFIDDLSAIIEPRSVVTEQRTSIKKRFVQFIELHEELYKYHDSGSFLRYFHLIVHITLYSL